MQIYTASFRLSNHILGQKNTKTVHWGSRAVLAGNFHFDLMLMALSCRFISVQYLLKLLGRPRHQEVAITDEGLGGGPKQDERRVGGRVVRGRLLSGGGGLADDRRRQRRAPPQVADLDDDAARVEEIGTAGLQQVQ